MNAERVSRVLIDQQLLDRVIAPEFTRRSTVLTGMCPSAALSSSARLIASAANCVAATDVRVTPFALGSHAYSLLERLNTNCSSASSTTVNSSLSLSYDSCVHVQRKRAKLKILAIPFGAKYTSPKLRVDPTISALTDPPSYPVTVAPEFWSDLSAEISLVQICRGFHALKRRVLRQITGCNHSIERH